MPKTIYNYDPVTRAFTNEAVADESPLEAGVYLLPANATTLAPPKATDRKVAVFAGAQWALVPDWRGAVLFSTDTGLPVSMTEVGKTPADVQATETPRPSAAHAWTGTAWAVDAALQAKQAAQAQADKWTAIKAERDRRIQLGGYKVGAKWYHSDTFSRTQQMGLVMLGASIPANTPWKTMDGTFVTMTQTLASQIFGTAAASDIAIFAAAEAHKTAMEASADPANYDFSSGWPKAYGD